MSNILELVTDAWNYPSTTQAATGLRFPHKVLDGISLADLPAEASAQAGKLLEHHNKTKK